jgi:hypothetical protein
VHDVPERDLQRNDRGGYVYELWSRLLFVVCGLDFVFFLLGLPCWHLLITCGRRSCSSLHELRYGNVLGPKRFCLLGLPCGYLPIKHRLVGLHKLRRGIVLARRFFVIHGVRELRSRSVFGHGRVYVLCVPGRELRLELRLEQLLELSSWEAEPYKWIPLFLELHGLRRWAVLWEQRSTDLRELSFVFLPAKHRFDWMLQLPRRSSDRRVELYRGTVPLRPVWRGLDELRRMRRRLVFNRLDELHDVSVWFILGFSRRSIVHELLCGHLLQRRRRLFIILVPCLPCRHVRSRIRHNVLHVLRDMCCWHVFVSDVDGMHGLSGGDIRCDKRPNERSLQR